MTRTLRTRAAALSLTAALASALLVGCGEEEPSADPVPAGSSTNDGEPTAEVSPGEDATTPTTEPDDAGEQVTVPVYLVGDTSQGPRLFREFRRVPAGEPLAAAAALVTGGDPLDPDYRSPFPSAAELASVSAEDGELVVELPDASWTERPAGMSRDRARLAVQALVYTLQGVQQERLPLRTELDGEPATLFGLDTGAGVRHAPPLDVLALVNVTSPEQGATVSGTITASGVASSFEATVPWEVRDADGTVVEKGFATAEGWMDDLYPWETQVDLSGLEPGRYTFAAMTADPSGGAEGPGPMEDTKAIVVE